MTCSLFFMPEILGTKKERELFAEVKRHYDIASEDLDTRIRDWDKKVELFYSHIDEKSWPYSSEIFVPHTFTSLFEKMARLNGGKPRGRLIPREGSDLIKAKINNELLSFQWDDAARVDNEPMGAKYALMDLNARIYGASFGLVKWRYECDEDGNVLFDGPTLKVLNNRDCLPNPAYSTIKNWFQYREYLTLQELQYVNDISQVKPKYKNLGDLRAILKNKGNFSGDSRESNYSPKGKSILGLTDYLGTDESLNFKVVEIVTELRNNRVISFAPKHGVIVRDEPNPYKHRKIPVICLKYIPVDDDIYGLSEIQPIEKLQKAVNALTSQYIDSVNMDLYRILQVRTTGVQMHTLKWEPGAKWQMNNPGSDVIPLDHSMATTNQFVNVYSVLTSMIKEAMGESSAAFSVLKPFSAEKTATEIDSRETVKNIRDNFNQVYQSEVIKQQTVLWQQMNKQFIFSDPEKQSFALRVLSRDAMSDFQRLGLDQEMPDMSEFEVESNIDMITNGIEPNIQNVPVYPVNVNGEVKKKFEMEETGEMGTLYIEPEDLSGEFDFIVDVEPMAVYNTQAEISALREVVGMAVNPAVSQMLAQEGKKQNISELLMNLYEKLGLRGADKYFESLQGGLNAGGLIPTQQGGAGQMQSGGIPMGNEAVAGMEAGGGMAQNPNIPLVG